MLDWSVVGRFVCHKSLKVVGNTTKIMKIPLKYSQIVKNHRKCWDLGHFCHHLGVILGSFWVPFCFWTIFHFLKGPVKNHVGPDGFLMIYARTEEVPFWSLFLETSPPGGQKAPGTLKKRLFLHLRVAMVDMLIPWGKPTFALSGTGFWECPNLIKNGVWAWGGSNQLGILDKPRFGSVFRCRNRRNG